MPKDNKNKKPRVSAEDKSINRDYLMARLGAAISEMEQGLAHAKAAMHVFVNPESDDDRDDAIEAAHDAAAAAVRSFEIIAEFDDPYDKTEAEPEPDDEEDDEEENEDEEPGGGE